MSPLAVPKTLTTDTYTSTCGRLSNEMFGPRVPCCHGYPTDSRVTTVTVPPPSLERENMSRLAIVALALWVITIAAAGYLFYYGTTVTATDGREAVQVTNAERNQILEEMRGMLQATADIAGALARSDNAAIAEIAQSVGSAAMSNDSPALLAKLPLGLKTAGMSVHKGFDELSSAAAAGATSVELTTMLSDQLAICVGCHATYRFSE